MKDDSKTQPNLPSPIAGIAPSGHRLPASTQLGGVRLQVADLQRSINWYQDVLGMRVISSQGDRASLAAHGTDHPLVQLLELPGATPVPQRGRLGLYHYALLLPDRPSLGAFLRHTAEVGQPVGAADHLVSEALYLQDPDGLGIEVYADRPRESWKVVDSQVSMSTLQLDARGLIASASGTPWTGMPAGTRMGHVHLHVGDLERASAFYHQGLGFDRIVWDYPGALFLSAGGYHHHVGLNTWAAATPAATDQDARLLDWEILLHSAAEVEATAAALHAAGFSTRADEDAVLATDPWGTTVRLTNAAAAN